MSKRQSQWRSVSNFKRVVETGQLKAEITKNNPPINGDKFTYNLELSGFNPKNIKVKTVGRTVVIEVTQQESNEDDGLKSYSKCQVHKPGKHTIQLETSYPR